jgi:hypothetical protein
MRTPVFPSAEQSAAVFFAEGVRHLNDAWTLFASRRYSAAVASAHTAQEVAVKAALIAENVLGNWEKIYKTHKPLTDISGVAEFRTIRNQLNRSRTGLVVDAEELEAFEPAGFTENAEYPYYDKSGATVVWVSPVAAFDQVRAASLCNVAREVLLSVQATYGFTTVASGEVIPANPL